MKAKTYPEYSKNYPLLLTAFMKRPVDLYPDEVGVVYRNFRTGQTYRFTWREWYERTCRLANALLALGVRPGKPGEPGDRVATIALNHNPHLELYYGVSCIGAVLHPINMRLSLDHMVHTITHAEDKVIFFDDLFLPLVEQIYDRIKGTVEKFVYISDQPGKPETKIENLYSYEELIGQQSPQFEWPMLHEDTYATLCYTTGTTGLPKGVMFTHRALYLMSLHMMTLGVLNNDPEAEPIGESGVNLLNIPLFHIHAWGAPYLAVFTSTRLVLPGAFTVEGFCELVQNEKVTGTQLVPTMLAMIIEYPELEKYDLSSIKMGIVGGAALPLGLKKKAEKILPRIRAASGYGMTETAPVSIMAFIKKTDAGLPKEELEKLAVKTGIPIPGIEAQVVDENMQPVPHDDATIGEIVLRGPWVMEQYYKDPERTAEVWRDGWFHTGDVAKVDKDGYITIADRISDMIRSGAEMVPTVLLENIAASADFILEAAVVGVPDDKWGQRPMALVNLVPGATETEEDVLTHLQTEGVDKGRITKWMLPDYVLITNEIPKTSVGKFNKLAISQNLSEFLAKAKRVTLAPGEQQTAQ
jgi:acyl-CoA synthetase (AMP-forming)/AMP-acid ligase II